jgi:pilus assembly protein Flp/PilA
MYTYYLSLREWFAARFDAIKDHQRGASAVEYGLLIGLIAVAIIAVLVILGPQLAGLFDKVSDELPKAPQAPAGG